MRGKFEKLALMHGGMNGFGKIAAIKKGMLLNSSELQLVTLHLLSQHPSHGYEIIKLVGDAGFRPGRDEVCQRDVADDRSRVEVHREGQDFLVAIGRDAQEISVQEIRVDPYMPID